MYIHQGVPCGADVDLTTPIREGRIEITPVEGIDVPGGKRYALTRLNLSFEPFSVHRDCFGIGETRNYTEESVELARTVVFTATPADPGAFNFIIPKEDFEFYQTAIVNGAVESGYDRPSEDVTGTINYTLGTLKMKAMVATNVHFRAGIIDEHRAGSLTVDLMGTIAFPDADDDKIPDRVDNCVFGPNQDQAPVPTPTIRAPFTITHVSCARQDIGRATGDDTCDGGPLTITHDAPAVFTVGPNLVTWQAVDAKQRVATAKQVVTIVDTTDPIFTSVPPNVEMNNCGPASLGLPTAQDDCAGPVSVKSTAPAIFPVGTTAVMWTAIDASGNQSTAAQMVAVVDTVKPAVSCVAAGPPGGTFQVTAADACGTPILRLGTFVLAHGERITITETGKPGVTLVGTDGQYGIRHFYVGKGEAVITATDPSANVGSAMCQ